MMNAKRYRELVTKSNIKECLYPNKQECSGPVVKAHSIQKNRILKLISKNRKVLTLSSPSSPIDATSYGRPSNAWEKTATTFTGFCKKHDNEVFKTIENKDYVVGDKEQEFLFAYRAFAYEFHTKKCISSIPTTEDSPMLNEQLIRTKTVIVDKFTDIKDKFDKALLSKDFTLIDTKTIELNRKYLIAVSSVFAPEYDFEGQMVNDLGNHSQNVRYLLRTSNRPNTPTSPFYSPLFFTVFPQNDKTYALFSYLKESSGTYDFIAEQLLALSEAQQIEKLNLIIASYCANVAYSPEKWESLNTTEKDAFIVLFRSTNDLTPVGPDGLNQKSTFNLFI